MWQIKLQQCMLFMRRQMLGIGFWDWSTEDGKPETGEQFLA